MRRMRVRAGNRGVALISAMMVVSVFLVYSNILTMRTVGQHLAIAKMREGQQALLLAQAAAEQLREEFTDYLNATVNQATFRGDLLRTTAWLDRLGGAVAAVDADGSCQTGPGPAENPPLDLYRNDAHDQPLGQDDQRDSFCGQPRLLQPRPNRPGEEAPLAALAAASSASPPRAWVESARPCEDPEIVPPADPLAPRCIVFRGEASVGSTHKAVLVTYEYAPGSGDVFQYAYFMNNFGWLHATRNTYSLITGEVRSNGNLKLSVDGTLSDSDRGHNFVLGDLYASENSELGAGPGQPGEGTITADRALDLTEYDGNEGAGVPNWFPYWLQLREVSRPARHIVWPSQIPIGGPAHRPPELPLRYGWDSEHVDSFDQEQRFFERQQPQTIPYIGDLDFYKQLAREHGSSITYYDYDADGDGNYAEHVVSDFSKIPPGDPRNHFQDGVYVGEDDTPGTPDDYKPVVLWGNDWSKLEIDGPIVVPGDVIIRGMVEGQGAIYAGRNIHIVGDVMYSWYGKPLARSIERNKHTGQLREFPGECNDPITVGVKVVGWVCKNGDSYNADGHYIDPVTGTADPSRRLSDEHPADCGE